MDYSINSSLNANFNGNSNGSDDPIILTISEYAPYGKPEFEYLQADNDAKGSDKYFFEYKFHEDCLQTLKIIEEEADISKWTEIFKNFYKYRLTWKSFKYHLDVCRTCGNYAKLHNFREAEFKRIEKAMNAAYK